jgi:hypothetical protein
MAEKYQSKEPVRIDYEIKPQDGYVTAVAHIASPSGQGEFELRVSGQREPVAGYMQKVQIRKLDIARIDDPQQVARTARQAVLDARRREWLARLEQARKFVQSADLTQLADPDLICHTGQPADKNIACKRSEEDLSQDRLIEIRPLDPVNPDWAYLLSFTIHPDVPQGKRDIYRPVVQGSFSASAVINITTQDADLELYRGGVYQDGSYSTSATDSVYGEGGVGAWKLHVIGYTSATYEISGDWVLLKNDV